MINYDVPNIDKMHKNLSCVSSSLKIHSSHLWWLRKTSKFCVVLGMRKWNKCFLYMYYCVTAVLAESQPVSIKNPGSLRSETMTSQSKNTFKSKTRPRQLKSGLETETSPKYEKSKLLGFGVIWSTKTMRHHPKSPQRH